MTVSRDRICVHTFVVDLTVAVNVGFSDHLVDLLVGELLPEVGHDVAQLGRADEPVAVLVEHSECLSDLLLTTIWNMLIISIPSELPSR